jgi:hypothetical protein
MSKVAYSEMGKMSWCDLPRKNESAFWNTMHAVLKEMKKAGKDDLSFGLVQMQSTAFYLLHYHRLTHYFVAPGVAPFCINSVRECGPEYLRPFPVPAAVTACFSLRASKPFPGGIVFHFPTKEQHPSIIVIPDYRWLVYRSGELQPMASGIGVYAANQETFILGRRGTAPAGGALQMTVRLVYGLSLYMDAFPDAIVPAADHSVHHLRHYKGEQRQIGRSPVMEHEEKQARSPHWRRGHFRVLHSEKFTHKRGQTVFVKGTFVRGQAFDILDDAPAARNGATP